MEKHLMCKLLFSFLSVCV